jgi:hypothetical protein
LLRGPDSQFRSLISLALCGCPAALVPMAVSAAGSVVSTVANVGEGAIVSAHQGDPTDEEHKGESEGAREDRCMELQMEAPGVLEVRKGAGGAPQYRQLELSRAIEKPQWTVTVDSDDTDPAGWRPATRLLAANFNPPLGPLPDAKSSYLAYRTADSEGDTVPLFVNFGKQVGTFDWKGQTYQFALAPKLPCFPGPPP